VETKTIANGFVPKAKRRLRLPQLKMLPPSNLKSGRGKNQILRKNQLLLIRKKGRSYNIHGQKDL
jgi:hypothetical protein